MGIGPLATQEYHLRRSCFKQIFNHIDATYPFQTEKTRNHFRRVYAEFAQILSQIQTDREFFMLLERFIASLHNSHTRLFSYPAMKSFAPRGYKVVFVKPSFFLFKHHAFIGKIVSIDGQPVSKIYAAWAERTASASLREERMKVKDRLLIDQNGDDANIEIETVNGNKKKLTIKRTQTKRTELNNSEIVSKKIFSGFIGYLRIASWSRRYLEFITKSCDRILDEFLKRRVKTIVIDLRKNQGGSIRAVHHVAGRLFKKKTFFAVTKTRISKTKLRYRTDRISVEPRMPYISAPVILLIDSTCLSATEYFIAGLKDNKRAILIGQPTVGSSGDTKTLEILYKKGKIAFRIPIWMGYRRDTKPIEGKGIKPDIAVHPTLEDLRKGKDVVLEAAIREAKRFKI